MNEFQLSMRSGWGDQSGTPADLFESQRQLAATGGSAGPYLLARLWDSKGEPIHVADKTDLDRSTSNLLDNTGWFLSELRKPDVARAELVFINPKAMKPVAATIGGVEGRPEPLQESGSGLAALEKFTNAVADSLHPSGTHGKWASCEWAVLTFTPAVPVAA